MHGLMMDGPLLITEIMRFAVRNHPDTEVVSVTVDDPRHRCTLSDVFGRARQLKIGQKDKDKGEIYFAMLNIFDRKYENAKGYPMPPKEIRGGLTLPF